MSQLDSLLTFWQFWRHIGENILVGGLVADLLVAIFFHERKPYERTGEVIATVLIIVGVVVENVAGGRGDDIIRQMRAPRSLNTGQQEDLAAKLKPLALIPEPRGKPERVDIVVFPVSNEATRLAHQIDATVSLAGWSGPHTIMSGQSLGMAVSGVAVLVMPDSKKSMLCGEALARELNSHGIFTFLSNPPFIPNMLSCKDPRIRGSSDDPWCSRILVLVGDHP